jgi:hypothetical protein
MTITIGPRRGCHARRLGRQWPTIGVVLVPIMTVDLSRYSVQMH